MSKEIQKHLLEFFKIQQLLGSGAYGHVWKVKHKQSHQIFALKKVFDAFQNQVDSQRTYREITILHELNHQHIVKLKGVIKAQNNKDLYLVFQHVQTDLHALVGEDILEVPHLLYIIYQIFKGLKYLHSAQLIHRDLKPSNILINSDCGIKLCDFGLVRSLTHQQSQPLILSQDVATRWYRSPQMLLGSQQYDWATDVWSVGCILAQLLIGQPIMMGGSNIQQLQKILQLTGIPKKQDIQSLKSPCAQTLIQQFKIFKKPFKHYFKGSKYQGQTELINLIKRMLQFNPNKRITVQQVLNHQILGDIRCKSEQKICNKVIIPQLDDNQRLTIDQYRKAIYKDIDRRYPQYKKLQPKQLSPQYKYQRAHHSLLNRTSSISSFNRTKACNSLLRPTRNKVFYKQNKSISPQRKEIQHKSLHCNTVHNSYFYKKAQSGQKYSKLGSSFHQTRNPFGQISNKEKIQSKQTSDGCPTIEKSPFRRYKKYQMYLDNNQEMKRIQGLARQQNSFQKLTKSQQNSINFTSYLPSSQKSKTLQPNSIKKNIYDPSVIYNQSPPKFSRSKQKNFYESMKVSNQNKIVKKTFTRNKKNLTFQRYKNQRLSIPHNNQNGSYITIVENEQK